ncbi:hypothetical protein ACS8FB_11100 [Psychrobacter sp. 1U1]|uniref:hypothetical protein n=2 Tax=unclassified Psychrobacter TaxID=196806 RepID=UPI003F448C3E
MKILQLSSIVALVTLTTLTGCQHIDKTLEQTLETKSSNVIQKLFNVETDRQFYITFPDHKNQVALTEFVSANDSQDSKPYVRGVLADSKNYSASLDYTNITALSISNDKNIFKFVAPYTLTNPDSDKKSSLDSPDLPSSALYLGAFELDYRTNNINQYGQQLLGEYSTLTTIDYNGQDTFNVVIRQYQTETDQNKKINSSVHKLTLDVDEGLILVNDAIVK